MIEFRFPVFILCVGQRFIKVVYEKNETIRKRPNIVKNQSIGVTQLKPYVSHLIVWHVLWKAFQKKVKVGTQRDTMDYIMDFTDFTIFIVKINKGKSVFDTIPNFSWSAIS